MKQLIALILAAAIFVTIIGSMGSRTPPPAPKPFTPDPKPDVSATFSPAGIPLALKVRDGQLFVETDIKLPTELGTIGIHISPHRVRCLYIKLGSATRVYEVEGSVKVYIPNSLNSQSSFEWGDDYGLITIENPVDLRFPDVVP